MTGAGLGAVYTVTLLPPPCGTSAIDRTFTPMVAQSSDEASLTITARFAVCVGVEVVVPTAEPPELSDTAAACGEQRCGDAERQRSS